MKISNESLLQNYFSLLSLVGNRDATDRYFSEEG